MSSLFYYQPGIRISGRYEVVGHPLKGGMGLVYLCFDHQEQRPVALKTFKPEFLPDRATRDRFLREGTTWVHLGHHPHLVHAYGVERVGDGREVYLVLELVAKEESRANASLRAWLVPHKPLPVEQALLFGLQIVRGMIHATAIIPGLIHRDLKPENILVGNDHVTNMGISRLRVTDFGLAAVLQDTTSKLQVEKDSDITRKRTLLTHGIVGTPEYMAPEQWEKPDVDLRSDIYAFGCVLAEMLTGEMLVKANPRQACGQLHQSGQVLKAIHNLPEVVVPLLTNCLVVDPDKRYSNWEILEKMLATTYTEATGQNPPSAEPTQVFNKIERVATGFSYHEIGASYMDISKASVAVEYFEEAVKKGQAEQEQRLVGAGLNGLGLAYRDLGNFTLAAEKFEQAMHIAREIGDQRGEGAALNNLGTCYHRLGRLKNALSCHEQRLSIAHKMGDYTGEGAALSGLGSIYEEMGQPDIAIRYHQQHLDIAREIEDRSGEVTSLSHLGISHFLLGQITKAESYHQEALDIAREIGDLRGEGRTFASLGQCCLQTNPEKAIRYFRKALSIARGVDDHQGMAGALGALAICMCQLEQWEEAEQLGRDSLEISDAMGATIVSGNTCLMLATLMMQRNRLLEALPLAERAAKAFSHVGYNIQYVQQAQQLVTQIQAAIRKQDTQVNSVQLAFKRFQNVDSLSEMQYIVIEFPFMTNSDFIAVIEQAIVQQVPLEQRPAFEQRLAWLRQISDEQKRGR
jgi:serine/threonine protein kinase